MWQESFTAHLRKALDFSVNLSIFGKRNWIEFLKQISNNSVEDASQSCDKLLNEINLMIKSDYFCRISLILYLTNEQINK